MTNAAKLASLGSPMIADTSGNVGIGTDSPARKLHVKGGAGLSQFESTGSACYVYFGDSTSSSIDNQAIGSSGNNLIALTGGTERMRIDSAGRVTMPYQPAFRATGGGGGGAVTTNPIPYPTEAFDIGGNYNTSTYRFTAPIAGVYHFDAGVYINNNNSNFGLIRMDVNGSQVKYAETQFVALVVSLEISIDLYLNANDYVSLGWTTTSGRQYFAGGSESHFCGHLVG